MTVQIEKYLQEDFAKEGAGEIIAASHLAFYFV